MSEPQEDPLTELLDEIATWAFAAFLAIITICWLAYILDSIAGAVS